MKKILLFLFLTCGNLAAQDREQINWLSWEQLEDALNEEPKKTFVFFHAEWCAYCKKIDRVVFTKPEVIKKINAEYYAVRMDAETTDTIRFDGQTFTNRQALTKRNGIHDLALLLGSRPEKSFSLPVTIFFNEQFALKQRVFEYYTSSELLKILEQ
ncbi:thioredoxin family protein [Leeuwenhoekiella aestuarii]|uniref:Thioredoxin-related protein n=1 Tax=Leeuwenhoekiella aestuarii TaxID=2249426 RepID=A0A4Q0NTA6_9FLAO|nr:thioredoxin family protein [Leeuwenhoekiella aestuarii]RXG14385.1 thioredoxin-related protein [Leeuwenhoekiella aestuarii]